MRLPSKATVKPVLLGFGGVVLGAALWVGFILATTAWVTVKRVEVLWQIESARQAEFQKRVQPAEPGK